MTERFGCLSIIDKARRVIRREKFVVFSENFCFAITVQLFVFKIRKLIIIKVFNVTQQLLRSKKFEDELKSAD